jgi:uncharacterized protein YecT (DUF1311 family)
MNMMSTLVARIKPGASTIALMLAVLATPTVAAGPADSSALRAETPVRERLAQASPRPQRPAPGEEGGILTGCPPGTIQKPETDDCIEAPPGREGSGNPVSGRSLGGILRSGPSQESRRVQSLREGQRITILRNTGVNRDNYPWFEIRVDGVTGFKWGGILCADVAMSGVYEVCKGSAVATPPTAQPPVAAAGGDTPGWCPTASLPAEHAICGNPNLGRLDGVLNTAYERATFDSRSKRAEIDHEHRRWIGRRNACGNDGGCIERRYNEQIQFLESYFGN